jgi:hypothetical protein
MKKTLLPTELAAEYRNTAMELDKLADRLMDDGLKNKAWTYFGIARLFDSLSYGSDMQTSALTAMEDAEQCLQDAMTMLKTANGIK